MQCVLCRIFLLSRSPVEFLSNQVLQCSHCCCRMEDESMLQHRIRQRVDSAVVRWEEKKENTNRWIMHFEDLATFVIKIPSVLWVVAECVYVNKQLLSILTHTHTHVGLTHEGKPLHFKNNRDYLPGSSQNFTEPQSTCQIQTDFKNILKHFCVQQTRWQADSSVSLLSALKPGRRSAASFPLEG